MDLICQKECINTLQSFAESNTHSIVISGPQSSGKTYLAKKYADMLNISDFQLINPTVNELRDTIESCLQLSTPIVLCIENLDTGVFAASSVLLKFLEEPSSNIYIVITCRNIKFIPDTIISRSHTAEVDVPNYQDLISYAIEKHSDAYKYMSTRDIWKCVRTFDDIDIVLSMDNTAATYIESLPDECYNCKCVSDMIWIMQNYPDKTQTPINIVIRYMIYRNPNMIMDGIETIRSLEQRRISAHAILVKFAFNLRYKWGKI